MTEASVEVRIVPGQIWREVDPRFDRLVRVQQVRKGRRGILVRTVIAAGNGTVSSPFEWVIAPRSRATWCDRERFKRQAQRLRITRGYPMTDADKERVVLQETPSVTHNDGSVQQVQHNERRVEAIARVTVQDTAWNTRTAPHPEAGETVAEGRFNFRDAFYESQKTSAVWHISATNC